MYIEAQNICMEFPSGDSVLRVIDGVDLSIPKGDLTMLMGPSGCGKTTLISILSAILTPTQGKVYVDGVSLHDLSENEKILFRRKHIGFIFQQYNLLNTLSIEENISIPLLASGEKHSTALAKARLLLEKLGLGIHIGKKPNLLSGGQQQRVAIARSLIHRPSIIVCDEPTAALDTELGKEIMTFLKQLSTEYQTTLIVVTHDHRILPFANRTIHMHDGKITE